VRRGEEIRGDKQRHPYPANHRRDGVLRGKCNRGEIGEDKDGRIAKKLKLGRGKLQKRLVKGEEEIANTPRGGEKERETLKIFAEVTIERMGRIKTSSLFHK